MSVALPEALEHYAYGVESFEVERRRKPLDFYRGNGIGQKKLVEYINHPDVDEVWWVSSTSGGKTFNCAHLGVAFAQNRPVLTDYWGNEHRIPQFGWGNVGWVLVQSYKQQVDATQKAYLEALGEWPHDIAWVDYGKGYIDTIYVAGANCSHGTGQHCFKCSRIVFRAEEGKADLGGRIDWAHIDEPCKYRTLDELRGRRQAGRKFKRFGSATFLDRSDWEWFVRDFEGCEDSPRRDLNRVWFRTTMRDNLMLSEEDIRKFEADFERSDLKEARLFGKFVDVDRSCPVDVLAIQALLRGCVRGLDMPRVVRAQTMKDMRQLIAPVQATIEVWWTPEENEDYFAVIDPSQGIKSVRRDPGALHIYAVHTPRLVARYNGYLGAYGLGDLAAQLGREYNDMRIDIDQTGGYGTATTARLQELAYSNFFYETKPDRLKQLIAQVGFKIQSGNRGEIISNLQEHAADPRLVCLSREVYESLLHLSIDDKGKVAAVEGSRFKDDDAICLGRAVTHYKSPFARQPRREPENDALTPMERQIAREHGRERQARAAAEQEQFPRDRFLDS